MKNWFFRKTFLGLLLSLALVPSLAGATTVAFRTESQMAQHATAIVRAKVISVQARWHSDNLIVTDVVMEALNVLKWDVSFKKRTSLFKMVLLGGTIGGKTLKVPGTSHYTPGEEVVVFFETGAGDFVEMGVGAGKYSIDRRGDKTTISRSLSGVAMATVIDKAATLETPPLPAGPELLADFERRILSYVNASVEGRK